mmetsp:Transcript_29228/g.74313  ORF Transcript_29228/g.74313 Transcript_29228/m.74313 type:complete len:264 (-) Transcript_29228:1223-2014(-)
MLGILLLDLVKVLAHFGQRARAALLAVRLGVRLQLQVDVDGEGGEDVEGDERRGHVEEVPEAARDEPHDRTALMELHAHHRDGVDPACDHDEEAGDQGREHVVEVVNLVVRVEVIQVLVRELRVALVQLAAEEGQADRAPQVDDEEVHRQDVHARVDHPPEDHARPREHRHQRQALQQPHHPQQVEVADDLLIDNLGDEEEDGHGQDQRRDEVEAVVLHEPVLAPGPPAELQRHLDHVEVREEQVDVEEPAALRDVVDVEGRL